MIEWNPWHGCHKFSEGCQNCYMFRRDQANGIDSNKIRQTKNFNLPLLRTREKLYRLSSFDNPIFVCLTSDFFIEEADPWRNAAWDIMHFRKDLQFKIITKRIHRFNDCLPKNWGRSYPNVTIVCTCENQRTADERLPILVDILAAHKEIIHEPMLENINIEKFLESGCIEVVTCGGESGDKARVCDYSWILNTKEQCVRNNVAFHFKQTGARFRKDGRIYHIDRKLQMRQAQKADIDFEPLITEVKNPFEQILFQLAKTKYRRRYYLTPMMKEYCRQKGMEKIRMQAFDIVRKNLTAPHYPGEGKQTPIDGHPIYVAQHATATCCRTCLANWHNILSSRKLTEKEIIYIVDLLIEWINRQLEY